MNLLYIQIATIIAASISFVISIFQILLFLGFPLGEYSWGGKYSGVLPKKLRMMSLLSSALLLIMGLLFLVHTRIFPIGIDLPTNILVWLVTVFLGLNTLGNLASKSIKEKTIMTPLAGLAFISCLFVSIFSM